MKAICIDIVIDKADTTQQRQALLALRDTVAAYQTANTTFAERINTSKYRRDEAPTKELQ